MAKKKQTPHPKISADEVKALGLTTKDLDGLIATFGASGSRQVAFYNRAAVELLAAGKAAMKAEKLAATKAKKKPAKPKSDHERYVETRKMQAEQAEKRRAKEKAAEPVRKIVTEVNPRRPKA